MTTRRPFVGELFRYSILACDYDSFSIFISSNRAKCQKWSLKCSKTFGITRRIRWNLNFKIRKILHFSPHIGMKRAGFAHIAASSGTVFSCLMH